MLWLERSHRAMPIPPDGNSCDRDDSRSMKELIYWEDRDHFAPLAFEPFQLREACYSGSATLLGPRGRSDRLATSMFDFSSNANEKDAYFS